MTRKEDDLQSTQELLAFLHGQVFQRAITTMINRSRDYESGFIVGITEKRQHILLHHESIGEDEIQSSRELVRLFHKKAIPYMLAHTHPILPNHFIYTPSFDDLASSFLDLEDQYFITPISILVIHNARKTAWIWQHKSDLQYKKTIASYRVWEQANEDLPSYRDVADCKETLIESGLHLVVEDLGQSHWGERVAALIERAGFTIGIRPSVQNTLRNSLSG